MFPALKSRDENTVFPGFKAHISPHFNIHKIKMGATIDLYISCWVFSPFLESYWATGGVSEFKKGGVILALPISLG